MSPSIRRLFGIVLLLAAVVCAVLNLHRVADLRMPWLAPMFMLMGAAFVISAKRRS